MKIDPGLNSIYVDLDMMQKLPREIFYPLLFSILERISALIILNSDEKKLKRNICKLSSKKRINRALAILRKEGVIDNDTYSYLKKMFRTIRCYRNVVLHPVCVEKCPPEPSISDVIEAVKEFVTYAKEFIEKRSSAAADSAIK